jgi:competence protein ComEC
MIEYILARPFIALLGLLATLHTTLLFLFNSGMGLNTISIYAAITILFLFLLLRKTRFSELLIFVLIILSLRLIQHFALSHRQENYKIEVCKKATDYMVVEAATARNHKLYVKGYFFRNECLERVYLTILKAPESQILYYGDTIWTASELNPVHNKPSRLFQAFDCYLTTIHVNYKSFIPYSKIKLSSFNGFSLLRVSQYLSEKCQQTIRQHIPTGQLAHLMIALLLGNKSGLDSQIKSDFIQSGTAHILAVSGLHLGMLYSILLIITNIINKARILTIKPLSKYFIIILSIWAFVLLTGSGNSIIRAAILKPVKFSKEIQIP